MAETQEKLGKYTIRGVLGRGAMGTVLDGFDPIIERRVAIKTIPLAAESEEAAEGLARFKREAQAAGRLQHANLVAIYDYGETDALAYIVMEYVDGSTLKAQLAAQQRFTIDAVVKIMDGVLAGLAYCHERGVTHRDIKPANIMITSEGDVKIADFGIARLESSQMTQIGTVMGTPAYMSPEQIMGQTVDFHTDLYSAGVVLYELLTGERPFDGSLSSIMHKALHTEALPPSSLSVNAPRGFDRVVAQAMAKRPEDRPASARAFAKALHEAEHAAPETPAPSADETIIAAPSAKPQAARPPQTAAAVSAASPAPAKPTRSRLLPIALIGGVAAAALAGGAYVVLQKNAVPPATNPATKTAPQIPPPPPVQTPANTAPETPPATSTAPTNPSPPQSTAAPQPVSPPPAAPAPADPAATAAATIAATPCTLASATATTGGAQITGLSAHADALHTTLASKLAGTTLGWHVTQTPALYCNVLNLLRAAAPSGPADLGLGLRGGKTTLARNDLIMPHLKTPDYPSYVTLDYFSNDGSMAHLYPLPGDRKSPFPADSTVSAGDKGKNAAQFPVAPPFGTDMIVAIASPTPLFAHPRPETDTAPQYLAALKKALESAPSPDRIAVQAIAVQTREK